MFLKHVQEFFRILLDKMLVKELDDSAVGERTRS
jgi:hypothetical protein